MEDLIKLKIRRKGRVTQAYYVRESTAKKYIFNPKQDYFIRYQRSRKITLPTEAGPKRVTHEEARYLYQITPEGVYRKERRTAPGDYITITTKPKTMPRRYQIEVRWKAASYDRRRKRWHRTVEKSYSTIRTGKESPDKAVAEAEENAEKQAKGWHTYVTGEGDSDEMPDRFSVTGVRMVAWVG